MLNEVRVDRTFGDDTSPKALNAFLSHFKLVKDQNNRRGVVLWKNASYRAGALRLVLTDEVAEFVDTEDSMSSSWVNDDVMIIERLKERYLKAECNELNILAFKEAKQLDSESLAAFLTRLQTLVKNAFHRNPESIMRQRVIWRFLTGVRDADIKKGLISSKWMASQDELKPYSEILKAAESIQMTKVASQSLAGRGNQRTVVSVSGMSGGYEDRRSTEDRSMRRPTGWNTGSKRKATVAAAGAAGGSRRQQAAAGGSRRQQAAAGGSRRQQAAAGGSRRQQAAAGGYNEAGRQSKGYVMKCYYCKELHEGGWQKCAKMKKNDPNWKLDF